MFSSQSCANQPSAHAHTAAPASAPLPITQTPRPPQLTPEQGPNSWLALSASGVAQSAPDHPPSQVQRPVASQTPWPEHVEPGATQPLRLTEVPGQIAHWSIGRNGASRPVHAIEPDKQWPGAPGASATHDRSVAFVVPLVSLRAATPQGKLQGTPPMEQDGSRYRP